MRKEPPKRWKSVFIWGWGYTVCPYCGSKTEFLKIKETSDHGRELKNNRRKKCPNCGKRVYAREGYTINQPKADED